MKKIKSIAKKILKYSIYLFSFLSLRNDKIIIVGCWFGQKFSDNSKYLYMNLLNKGYSPIWVTKNKSIYNELKKKHYPVAMFYSFKGIWTHLRAGIYFTSTGKADVAHLFMGNALHVELWHGIPIKKIMHDDINNGMNSKFNLIKTFFHNKKYYVVYSSENYKQIYERAFRVKSSQLLCLGQPRNDVFFNDFLEDKDAFPKELKTINYILYLPTHRNEGAKVIEVEKLFNLKELDDLLRENQLYFVIKKHFYHQNERTNLSDYSNILDFTGSEFDTQLLMKYSKALITDYSSCYIDYLLLDKPIIMYCYDIKNYQSNDRELYFPYKQVIPNESCDNYYQVKNTIMKYIDNGFFAHVEKSQLELKNFFYDTRNQKIVSDDIIDVIFDKR